MKIKLSTRRNRAQTLWVIILVIALFLVVVGSILIVMIKAIQKIVPPPPKDTDASWNQIENDNPVGSTLSGGVVQGYYPIFAGAKAPIFKPEGGPAPVPPGFIINNVYIYASDTPFGPWTNLLLTVPFSQLSTVIGDNGLPLEQFTNGQPQQRFYNFIVDGQFQ